MSIARLWRHLFPRRQDEPVASQQLDHLFKMVLYQLGPLCDLMLYHQTKELQAQSENPLNKSGMKCFSQTDEDGITLEILRRMGCLADGVFAEFGVGNGMENNSLILAALGWRGFWVGGEDIAPDVTPASRANRFAFLKEWITRDNIVGLARSGLEKVAAKQIDVLSLDLDGNDIYLTEAILHAGFRPKLFIVEYNGKFPPPVKFAIAYDPQHVWRGDDYFGASLASFAALFSGFQYRLVCCNAHTGGNAFFIDTRYNEQFADVPTDMKALYREPRYWLYNQYGHRSAVATVERVINAADARR
jgi:hypothetical protein